MNYRNIVARGLIRIADELLEAFDMTEDEWKRYHRDHPGSKRWNHHIIPTPRRGTMRYEEWEKAKMEAKKKYFADMKEKHPNYVPILSKDKFQDILQNGEYTTISAGLNTEDEIERKMARKINKSPSIQEFVRKRTEQLRKDLDALGVEYTKINGSCGNEEPSFLISHTLKAKVNEKTTSDTFLVSGNVYENNNNIIEKLNESGAKYNQDSVGHVKNGRMELHYTTGKRAGMKIVGSVTKMGPQKVDGNFYYSEARLGDEDYTMWHCKLDFDHLKPNPYFKKSLA